FCSPTPICSLKKDSNSWICGGPPVPERCTYGETLLKIDHVSLSYEDKVILRDVNAEIRDIVREGRTQGQVVGFLGPSGIGKTQLFRIIAGLNHPTSGQVLVNSGLTPVKAGMVGVVAQNYPLFENRTIFSNLMLAAKQMEKGHEAAHERVLKYLRRLDMVDQSQLYPAQISGGQRPRVALPGARIQETYDLIERDMWWHPELTNSPKFLEFVREVKERFQTL